MRDPLDDGAGREPGAVEEEQQEHGRHHGALRDGFRGAPGRDQGR